MWWLHCVHAHRKVIDVRPDSLALLSQLAVVPRYPGWDEEDLDSDTVEEAVEKERAADPLVAGLTSS